MPCNMSTSLPPGIISSYPTGRLRDLYGSLSAILGITWFGCTLCFTGRDEVCYIIGGDCRLDDAGHASKTVLTGDAILTSRGFRGHREPVATTTRHFVIRQHPEARPDP